MINWMYKMMIKMTDRAVLENERLFLSLIQERPQAKLLDIGCANAEFSLKISQALKTGVCFGIELEQQKAKAAKAQGVEVIVSDANEPFAFRNDSFDAITANQIIEHLYDADNFFKELHRVLKKGGEALISSPNLCSWHNLFFMLLGMQPPGMHLVGMQAGNFLKGLKTQGHIRLFSLSAIREIAKLYGFTIEKTIASGYYPFCGFLARFFSMLDKNHAVFFIIKIRKI
jgi:ubiquinone/menaquinone biosynthesis C-methylase UbiE